MSLTKLHLKIRRCKECRLWKNSKNAVPGEGPKDAKIMLIGQGPGEKEDETGRPFVGRAGEYLDEVLEKNNIERKKIFITSIVKHKTPDNRKPKKDEIKACFSYLEQQIDEIKPDIVVLMGNVAKENAPRKK